MKDLVKGSALIVCIVFVSTNLSQILFDHSLPKPPDLLVSGIIAILAAAGWVLSRLIVEGFIPIRLKKTKGLIKVREILTTYISFIALALVLAKFAHLVFGIELWWLYPIAIMAATTIAFTTLRRREGVQ